MALVAVNVSSLYIRTLSFEIEENCYNVNEADLLQKVKDNVNTCIWELTDTKKEFIDFLQIANTKSEEFFKFVRIKNIRLSEINKSIAALRKSLDENNQDLICCIQNYKNKEQQLFEERLSLESAKKYLQEKISYSEAEYQQIDSDIIQVADNMDLTAKQVKEGRRGMGIGMGMMAAGLPFGVLGAPVIILGAAVSLVSAQKVSEAANDNHLQYEHFQDLQDSYSDIEAEIQEIYEKMESTLCSLETIPATISALSNKSEIFRKIYLFVCDFHVVARNCQIPLKHIITICEGNRAPPSHLEKIFKRNKENLAAKITDVIESNMIHFDKISNQTLDYQIKIGAIEDDENHYNLSSQYRSNYMARNLLTNSNPNGKNDIAKNADRRWEFEGPWKYGTPVFLHTHYDPCFEDKFDTCYETSCTSCKKSLIIDLDDIGMTDILNTYQPPILFSEWVVNRADCGSKYQSSITLLDHSYRVIAMEEAETVFKQWQLQKWQQLEIKIDAYPSNVRYIRITSSGKDTQYWEGHYGVKIAGSELKIHLDDVPLICLLDDQNPKGDKITRYADPRWHFTGPWKYDVPVFLDNHFHPSFENMFDYCYETSYTECKKVLEVDLKKIGMTGLMDHFRPTIIFSEWIINRADCGSKYHSSLALLDKSHKIIAETNDKREYRKWHLQIWEKVELQIHAYPPGVRYIQVKSSGQDTQYWQGHYGVKIAGSELLMKL